VLEYLAITEVVDRMEDLVTYVKVQLSIYYNDNETSYNTLYRVLLSGTGWCVCVTANSITHRKLVGLIWVTIMLLNST